MRIEVAAAIIKKNGRFMIAKRAAHKHLGGLWEFPGGKIEMDETAEDCLKRELEEELKIQIRIIKYLAENEHDYGSISITLKAYLCNLVSGEITLVDHDEIRWVTYSQLYDYPLAPADIPFVKLLKDLC